jgi:CubicO group peptidase (beta-lactamase class C family)
MPTLKSRELLLGAALGLLLLSGCSGPEPRSSADAANDWVLGEAAQAGFDPAALDQLVLDIEAGVFPNTHALLIEHDGALVFERYFSGSDERWGDPIPARVMGPDSLHDLRSVSKSVTSALLGIALVGDFSEAVARPVAEHLPDLELEPQAREITLHQVLTMTTGLQWNEMTVPYTDPMNDEIRLYSAGDPALYVTTRPIEHEPGSTWYYSGGSTQVLASVIMRLVGCGVQPRP